MRYFLRKNAIQTSGDERIINYEWPKNNSEESSKIKVGEYIPCGYSMSTIWIFNEVENNRGVHRGKDCMKKFFGSFRKQAIKVIDFKRRK